MYRKLFKRTGDILLASAGMFIFLPVWGIILVGIWLEDQGPGYYLQDRVGKDGKIFSGIKFRSMIPDAENGIGPVQAKENDPRTTKLGRFLRKTAMDELPQLLNILKGEMSFVGPRALRPAEIDEGGPSETISIFQVPGFKKRSSVQPGLTGAAQVLASRKLSLEDKFKYDLWYVDNLSFWLDIRLILKSVFTTLRAKWDT